MILAVANQKGGVGKTTTAINLSAALALEGSSVLLVDLDPQGHSTVSYLDRDAMGTSVYEVLVENAPLEDAVHDTDLDGLHVVPSRISLAKLEVNLAGEFDAPYRLRDQIGESPPDRFDYIVIDTPPALGLLTVNALVAASHLLVPIQASYLALEGTDDLLDTVQRVKDRINPDLELLGVLITMHDRRTILGRDVIDQVKSVFGPKVFSTIISRNVRLEESPAYKEPIFTHAPSSTGARQYASLGEEVRQRV